jgi:Ser-tRNA(Ala) deacylase AlaX
VIKLNKDNGRLQTAEHIFARLLEEDLPVTVGMCRFREDYGTMEVHSRKDMREVELPAYERKVQEVIDMDIRVTKEVLPRDEASKVADLGRVPERADSVRIVDIEGFDRRACRDPHVDNTSEIGRFRILKVKKAGRERFRFTFTVD